MTETRAGSPGPYRQPTLPESTRTLYVAGDHAYEQPAPDAHEPGVGGS